MKELAWRENPPASFWD